MELATLTHDYPQDRAIDGYEKALYDAINGDQSHFVHADEVMESWRIVDDLLCTGDSFPFVLFLTSILVDGDQFTK